jgi:anaerobic selenocysteine-containing dehydrogenase/Fe-S-cluster-containing dehydrogenase component
MSDGIKRRDFLKVLGVSGAGVAAAGCQQTTQGGADRLLTYVIPAEEIVPGVPTYYASTCRECPAGCGILVETHEGRVTKVEGNPAHPVSRGNLCARGQASVQGLYHPDRYPGPSAIEDGIPRDVTWTTAERLLAQRIQEARPGAVAFLSGSYGPTLEQVVDQWAGTLGVRRVVYDPWGDQPRNLSFADADFLIAFGADFLETWGSPVDYAWQFAQMHSYRNGQKGRFVWVGPHRPLTGLNADEWIAALPGSEHLVAQALAGTADIATVAQQAGVPADKLTRVAEQFRAAARPVALGPGVAMAGRDAQALRQAVAQLNGTGGQPAQPTGMQQVLQLVEQMRAGEIDVLFIDGVNPVYTLPGGVRFAEAMQNVRTRVSFSPFPDDTARLATIILPTSHFLEAWDDYASRTDVLSLVQPAMRPVFNTRQLGDVLLGSLRAAGTEATTMYDRIRTAWGGDGAAWREALRAGGSFTAPETVVAPPGMGFMGMTMAGAAPAGPGDTPPSVPLAAQVARPSQQQIATQRLTAGTPPAQPAGTPGQPGVVVPGAPATAPDAQTIPAPAGTATPQVGALGVAGGVTQFEGADGANFFLVVYPSYRFFDGRTANRPWLLELPDPVTKIPWHSWVEIHPQAAQQLGVRQGEVVEVTSPYGTIETFVYVYPGVRPDTVAMQMGLGHAGFGRFTEGRGANPNLLLGPTLDEAGNQATYGVRVAVRRSSGTRRPGPNALFEQGVRVQHDRDLSQAVSVARMQEREAGMQASMPGKRMQVLKGAGGFAAVPTGTTPADYPPPGTRFGEYIDGLPRWAMVVDLDRCIGCAACVTACNAENNIAVVGPDEMRKGRELHWLRIERYWGVSRDAQEALTDDATDDTRFLPMLCQHCNNAPCEPVCPVYAAYHTPDGLNGQVYNRCVGTRYCANNCPWKVRYFNWWTYEFARAAELAAEPGRDGARKGRDGEVHLLRAADPRGPAHRGAHRARRAGRRGRAGVRADLPDRGVRLRQHQGPEQRRGPRSDLAPQLPQLRGILNVQSAVVYLQKVTHEEPARARSTDRSSSRRTPPQTLAPTKRGRTQSWQQRRKLRNGPSSTPRSRGTRTSTATPSRCSPSRGPGTWRCWASRVAGAGSRWSPSCTRYTSASGWPASPTRSAGGCSSPPSSSGSASDTRAR